eukprot:3672175-Rhodomonas_salina.1
MLPSSPYLPLTLPYPSRRAPWARTSYPDPLSLSRLDVRAAGVGYLVVALHACRHACSLDLVAVLRLHAPEFAATEVVPWPRGK